MHVCVCVCVCREDICCGCVLSIGYNPYYSNTIKTWEVFFFYNFSESLVDAQVVVAVYGFIRCEANFKKFGHFILALQNDCEVAREVLSQMYTHTHTQATHTHRETHTQATDTPKHSL
eukprot:GHVR01141197.1.p1 GENE.GHVR01141197.1~~GHVR01141197.1.p1  ORF type:complete len:118 (+),score=47.43 GHVR01141197.1:156-509(+)